MAKANEIIAKTPEKKSPTKNVTTRDSKYKFDGKWKLDQFKDKQNPQGRLTLDLK